MSHFAANLAVLRKVKNLSPTQLASMAHLSPQALHAFEQGDAEPGTDELIRLSDALNVSIDSLVREDHAARRKYINGFQFRFLALDIDGVMTDGGMYYTQGGDEFKKFNTKDGMAIIKLTSAGFPVGFISSGINENIIRDRAQRLGVEYVYVGTWKKLDILQQWCDQLNITLAEVAYVGDDINDLPVITQVGLSACPSDAVEKVRATAKIVLENKGGEGCVREFIENYLHPVE